ncbi:MAG: glycosyltransferase family 2 protein [Solirubrobacteraceae bacterium]
MLRVLIAAPRIDLDPNGPSVSVVIPALNEAPNLPWLASRMPAGVGEIILVDGCSTDDTIAVAQYLWPDVRIVTQTRRGKGNALACGFAVASCDVIVMIDADGSMDPGEIPYFVAALIANADYVKGSRFAPGGGSSDITRFRATGNHVLNALTGLIHRTSFTDLCYGFNAFWRRILPVLGLEVGEGTARRWGDGFEVETLINIRVHSAGLKVTEVPSFEGVRLHGSSNLRAFADGWRVLAIIARESRALRKAPPGSALAPLLDEPIATIALDCAPDAEDRPLTSPHRPLMHPIQAEPHLAEIDDPLERLGVEMEEAAELADLTDRKAESR